MKPFSNTAPITTSLAIATGTDSKHKSVLGLIRQCQADLEVFGRVAFETCYMETASGARPVEIARLNERQACLVLARMPNNALARTFTHQLADAFHEVDRRQKLQSMTRALFKMRKPREPTPGPDPMLAMLNRMVIAMETLAQRNIVALDADKARSLPTIPACRPPCQRRAGCT
ncbi:MAG: Rha family transcriptional regulator [Magnetococcales bacterium]|nr:Rha family transcriptional regulator [Magnetococcales bacterium]